MYEPHELHLLWGMIAQRAGGFDPAPFAGLRAVRFPTPRAVFERRYLERVRDHYGGAVQGCVGTSVDHALRELARGYVVDVHPSCASRPHADGTGTALCIHYSRADDMCAIALPGVALSLK